MRLDAGKVLKRSVLCGHCKSDYLFTLRDIAESSEDVMAVEAEFACVIAPIKHSLVMLKIICETSMIVSRQRYSRKRRSLFGWHTCDYAAEESGTERPPCRTGFKDQAG